MKVIGVTGGVGSGKSEILNYLQKEYGAVICQLDEVAKDLQKRGQDCFEAIVDMFGLQVVGQDGELNRMRLGEIVFSDGEKLQQLNDIVHPKVKQKVKKMIREEEKKQTPLFVIESAILPDAGYEDICEEMWYIYTEESVRRERLKISRGYSDDRTTHMIASQPDEDKFRKVCSKVIDNSGAFEDTKKQIGELI